MNRVVQLIDVAMGTLKGARDHLRHDPELLASDLSEVIGTARELVWTIDTLTAVLVRCLRTPERSRPRQQR